MTHRHMSQPRAARHGATTRLARFAVVLVAAAIAVLGLPAAPAQAHATLVTTRPARNAVVPNSPAEVVLTFSEPVRVVPDRIKVVDPEGVRADAGQARVEGQTVRVGLRTGGPKRGTYVVSFRVTSADSHPVGGSFSYSVVAPSAPGSAAGVETSGSGGAVAVVFPVVRGLGYAALALLIGAGLVLSLLWPRRLDRRGAVRLLWTGAVALAVTSLLEVLLEIWYVSGTLAGVAWPQVRDVVLSQYGAAHAVRIGVALAGPVLLGRLLNRNARTQVVAVVVGVIGLATWPASGHPVVSPVPALSLVADLIHLAAMSVWLGGLAVLAAVLLPRATSKELAGIVPVWSRWAQLAVATLLATGVVQSLIEVGSVGALFATSYGVLVVAKVGLLAAVLAIAWHSRRLVPRISERADNSGSASSGAARRARAVDDNSGSASSGAARPARAVVDRAAAGRLRRLVAAETAGIAIVLAVASVLVQTPPARGAAAATTSNDQTVLLANDLYQLSVQIVPGTVGLNELHLYAYTPEGAPADVKEWRVTAAPSNQDTEPIPVDLLPVPPDHAIGQVTLPGAGPWRFTFTLRTTEIDQAAVATTFDIRPA